MNAPSPWVQRFAQRVPPGGRVLDIACGRGRHTRLFLDLGHPVVAIDRDLAGLAQIADHPGLTGIETDLESEPRLPLEGDLFAGVVVTNYLHRPLLPQIVARVAPEGVLIYETFACGNERFGRPSNPDYLLRPGELLSAVSGQFRVIAFEDLIVKRPRPAALQRLCARREPG